MRRLGMIAIVGVLLVTLAGCDFTQLGQTQQSSQIRYYNNAQYGTIAVLDYGGSNIVNPAVATPATPGAAMADGANPWECALAVYGSGVSIIGAISLLPEDAPILPLLWTGVGADVFGAADCINSWQQTVQWDALSRTLFVCSNPQGYWYAPELQSDGYCMYEGWVAKQIIASPNFTPQQKADLTGCHIYYSPFHGLFCVAQ